ncbi:MAG: FAD:protein FMN transferase, partial [Acidimicrobiales bacterium]
MAVAEARFRVMASDTQVIVVDGPPEAGNVAHRALDELERAWSRFVPGSDIDRLNHCQGFPVVVNEATLTLVETMVQAWQATSGLLDPTVLPALLEAGYRSSVDDPEVFTTLPAGFEPGDATMADVVIDRPGRAVTLPEGLVLDPGGIGKGLAADLVTGEVMAAGATGVMVNLGGDLRVRGAGPHGQAWAVSVREPMVGEEPVAT